jgi:hypothetical protein
VLREQIRAVGLALRLPAIAAAALVGVATLLTIGEFVTSGGRVDFAPELSLVPGIVGALLPIGVWTGERRFGASVLWMLPVDRRRHALTKVAAGWACLMVGVTAFVLWMLALAFFTGGDILGEQRLLVLPSLTVPPPGTLDASALRTVRWTPSPLLWLAPLTGATGAYVLTSALALGTRHPVRWIVGAMVGVVLLSGVGAAAHIDWLRLGPARLVEVLNDGPYGLDALLSARTESLHTQVTLAGGRTIGVWRALPDLGDWAAATLLWTTTGLLALWAAASRHRERRRG